MKTYARIEDGQVAELFQTDGDITRMFHPSLVWMDVTNSNPQPQPGWAYDGNGFAAPVVTAVLLATLQGNACDQIDAAAGQARGKYVTVTSMQSAVYEMKYDEAVAYQAATNPVATDYPHLNAEATQTNTPIATVAANVISTRNAWVQVSAKIEGYRLGGKAEVNAATDADGVQAALETALANLEACRC